MQLSDTTNQSGLVQKVEFWTRRPYGTSGNELREIINLLNQSFESITPDLLLALSDHITWDDPNHTDAPIGYVDIVSGQSDYKLTEDDNSLDILNITDVRILQSASATDYEHLRRLTLNDWRALNAQSPNSDETGTPTYYLEVGNRLYVYPQPDYSVSEGIEIFFQREQQYFTVTGTSGDDTTEPGIPKPFHELLALHAARDWVALRRPDAVNLLTVIDNKIFTKERQLKKFIERRNPRRTIMTPKLERYI